MALAFGTRIGPYEVIAQIGAGGMGEVYRARDAKLGRDVALKVLPESVASNHERVARFEREAKTLAALNHPNIAAIYGLEDSASAKALVMELVEGLTLADRIARGAIPLEEVLPIAKQIAEALEAAHEQGIIHRDLKPANIKVRPDGTVKVLDFGLAKALEPVGAMSPSVSQAPTITTPAITQAGMLLGTASYMSPEQARGRVADKRADIWAFGCVFYEMLSGRPVFAQKSLAETLSDVMKSEPNWGLLPADLPAWVQTVARRCLEKDVQRRLRDMGDVRLALDGAFAPPIDPTTVSAPIQTSRSSSRWPRVAVAVGAPAVAAALVGLTAWSMTPRSSVEAPIRRFAISLPKDEDFSAQGRNVIAVAPDARHVVYVANSRLYIRAMDQLEATAIPGSDSGGVGNHARMPFFSPDGRWLAFWQEGQLRKMPIDGGAAIPLCDAALPYGATWGSDDVILFGNGSQGQPGVLRVSASGGAPESVLSADASKNELVHGPQLLPGGRAVLFTLRAGGSWDDAQIIVQSLGSNERQVLVDAGRDARYVESGHVLYARQGAIFALPFDVQSMKVLGNAVPVADGVRQAPDVNSGAAQFSVARDGTLVYVPANDETSTLVWVDREGRETNLPVPSHQYRSVRLSPDGSRVALSALDQQQDIWTWDLSREVLSRFTFDAAKDEDPVWASDGQRILFTSERQGPPQLFSRSVDGTGEPTRLSDEGGLHPNSVSSDGRHLVLRLGGVDDIAVMTLQPVGPPEPLIRSRFTERNGEISPNGRWIAFESDESGQLEVYIRSFPALSSQQWKVSTKGGHEPLWARSGKELFYRSPDRGVMAVAVDNSQGLVEGTPMDVIRGGTYLAGFNYRTYDVSPDGRRFLMLRQDGASSEESTRRIVVVEHWLDDLERRVPKN